MFIKVLFGISPNWKQSKCPATGEQINKAGNVTRVVLSHKHGVNSQYTARLDESQSHYAE